MDASTIKATKAFVQRYSEQAAQSFESQRNRILELFTNKKCPETGWNEADIEILLLQIGMMDSNNFVGNCGVGEREARFASNIVARRHYRMGHGIGRSGDIMAIQPKAVGSSLINKLANEFVLDILHISGAPGTKKCLIVPMATGMSIVLCLRTMHSKRPHAKYVIWPRIDQKSCFKCILTAGLIPVIINNDVVGEQQTTNLKALRESVNNLGPENIVCILTTTSCFAPRAPDSIEDVGQLCVDHDIPHLINNAYGVQCQSYMHMIEKAAKKRVDVYVSSTDKNFMVPVGGSVIAAFNEHIIEDIGKMYPGRASGSPSMDVFITLINIGTKGYQRLLHERNDMWKYLKVELQKVGERFGEKVIDAPDNQISIGLTLKQFQELDDKVITEIGSMLFSKFVSGTRVINPGEVKDVEGYKFLNWGTHNDFYNCSYLTAAATLGVTKSDIDLFTKRLRDVLSKVYRHASQNM